MLGDVGNGDLEAIRGKYWPADGVRVLLLGESPPPGRGFFYTGDSSLYRFTLPVFVEEYDVPDSTDEFLTRFAEAGFFLDDFSSTRGDKPAQRADASDVRDAVKRIAKTIRDEEPEVVVGVLLGIRELVDDAVSASALPETPWQCLHFPHPKNKQGQRLYQEGLRGTIREYGREPPS